MKPAFNIRSSMGLVRDDELCIRFFYLCFSIESEEFLQNNMVKVNSDIYNQVLSGMQSLFYREGFDSGLESNLIGFMIHERIGRK